MLVPTRSTGRWAAVAWLTRDVTTVRCGNDGCSCVDADAKHWASECWFPRPLREDTTPLYADSLLVLSLYVRIWTYIYNICTHILCVYVCICIYVCIFDPIMPLPAPLHIL